MKRKRDWIIALGVAASAYAVYIGIALNRSVAELHRADAAFARAAPGETRPTGSGRKEPASAAPQPPEPASGPTMLHEKVPAAVAGAHTAVSASAGPEAPSERLEEDPNILRQRALLDAAAHPELAELFNSQDPKVRTAVLDFFDER